jgi:chorismate synthase
VTGNTIGQLFSVTTFGESHGEALGCIVDGCPPGLSLVVEDLQKELDKRKPSKTRFESQRREPDKVKILSGVFEGVTTGTPIALQINNTDAKTKDYADLKDKFRPSHGDYVYQEKYGVRDYRGGGRASARETVARVAAGAIAKKYLFTSFDIKIQAYISQIGHIKAQTIDMQQIYENPFNFPDPTQIAALEKLIINLQREGDSIGAKLVLCIEHVPAGIGEPVFAKLDAELAYAFMGINAVKAVEIGAGVNCVIAKGSEFRDEITPKKFLSNNAGGILAGISTGQTITAQLSFKPTPSIRIPGKTIDAHGQATTVATNGRHDPCVGIRAVAIAEAMAAIVIMDHLLRHRGQNGRF